MTNASRLAMLLWLTQAVTAPRVGAVSGIPTAATSVQANLVRAYAPCAGPTPCAAVPLDPMDIGFGPGGSGKLKVRVSSQNTFVVSGSVRRLRAAGGTILCPVLSLRVTTDACGAVPASCTMADVDWPTDFDAQHHVGCCTLDSFGSCHFSARIVPPASGNLDLLGCGLRRESARCVGGDVDGTPCPKAGACSSTLSPCARDADCSSSCVGGTRPGSPCATDGDCPFGTCTPGYCMLNDCGAGVCDETLVPGASALRCGLALP